MTARNRRASWVHPSLSRDFALLSAAILFVMLLISAWVAWITYIKHSEIIVSELQKETGRIERTLESEIVRTGYLLSAIGRQISLIPPQDHTRIAQLLQAFATGDTTYAVWNWSDADKNIVVSSNLGILDQPVDVSDRDYIESSKGAPWTVHIGSPVEGRLSGRWVIPVVMGVTDTTGRYIGTLTSAVDIGSLTDQISHLVKREGISYAIVSKQFVPLTVVADSEAFEFKQLPIDRLRTLDLQKSTSGVMSEGGLLSSDNIYSYYLVSGKYPYIITVGYDAQASDNAIRGMLWPRMIQIAVVAGFLLSFLWIIRARVIKPVIELGYNAASVAAGGRYSPLQHSGPQEIEHLSSQIGLISDYIAERHLIEDELRNKIALLHGRQRKLQTEIRQRAALLAGLQAEYKRSLRNINSHAQVLKDERLGPIGDAEYRQHASDIHQTGTTLELMVRKLIALSRVDAAAVVYRDEPARLAALLDGAARFAAEGLPGGTQPTLSAQSPLPDAVLQVDSLHVQQALAYALLYLCSNHPEAAAVSVDIRPLANGKNSSGLLLLLGQGDVSSVATDRIGALIDDPEFDLPPPTDDELNEYMHLALTRSMLEQQQITVSILRNREIGIWLVLHIPSQRVVRL